MVIVAFDGVQLLDVVGPADVLDAATRILAVTPEDRDRLGERATLNGAGISDAEAGYLVSVATPLGAPAHSSTGIELAAHQRLSDIDGRDIDTLIVAGALSMAQPLSDASLVSELPRIAAGARRVCSVCGGAFLLAEAGLLAGRRATTHWAACQILASRYPDTIVEPDRIFVRDGKVLTSAGATASIDLTLALVEEDYGAGVARSVARLMVVFLRREGGQSQFSARQSLPVQTNSAIRELIDQIIAEPGSDHRLPEMADRVSLSERQLSRVFLRETHTTPGRFVERVRVDAARELLEASPSPVDVIAAQCGFGSAETMRRAFQRVLGVAPAAYRHRFRYIEP